MVLPPLCHHDAATSWCMEKANPCRHHFYIFTNCQYRIIVPQFQKNHINFQGISAPFFQCLFDIFPKSHSIQLSIHKSKPAHMKPRGYHVSSMLLIIYTYNMVDFLNKKKFFSKNLYIKRTFKLIFESAIELYIWEFDIMTKGIQVKRYWLSTKKDSPYKCDPIYFHPEWPAKNGIRKKK